MNAAPQPVRATSLADGGSAAAMATDAAVRHRRRQRRRRRLRIVLVLVAALAVWSYASCTSAVVPPRDPDDPIDVYLLADALHYGLVLPRDAHTFVEYGYGDWGWYALGHDSWYHVFDTMLWPTQGALGRRDIDVGAGGVREQFPSGSLHTVRVARARAAALLADLDERFAAARASERWNGRYGLWFVHHDRGFWLLHNCTDATASWLEALGCDVGFALVRGGLRLAASD